MTDNPALTILPYSRIVGQAQAKLALELAYVARPRISGVLLSGERGTAKSTLVRAFAYMMDGKLPVTLPINATEDRVLGGWKIDELMAAKAEPQEGLLKQAHNKILYVDEVNLLDDYLVNLILDAAAMGVVVVQRDSQDEAVRSEFTLVGTMNPEEGGLRPQLLDRFGLMVAVTTSEDPEIRQQILRNVLAWDDAIHREDIDLGDDSGRREDSAIRQELKAARARFAQTDADALLEKCTEIAKTFKATGHRGELTMMLAARANAARKGTQIAGIEHLREVVPMALRHRRTDIQPGEQADWGPEDEAKLTEILGEPS